MSILTELNSAHISVFIGILTIFPYLLSSENGELKTGEKINIEEENVFGYIGIITIIPDSILLRLIWKKKSQFKKNKN